MWFFSKQKLNRRQSRSVRFLRKPLPEQRERRTLKKDRGSRNLTGVFSLWVIFFGTLLYILFFSPLLFVEKIQISGTNEVSREAVQNLLADQLSGKYFHIFPKCTYVLVRPETLVERLRFEYPLLATVSIEKVFPNGINVSVREKKKILLWNSLDSSYLIDEDGTAHDSERALSPENKSYVLTITDMSGRSVAMGEKVFDPSYGVFVVKMNESFSKQIGLSIDSHDTVISRFAEELRIKTDEGWWIYFSANIPVETSLNELKLLLEKELIQEKRSKLAYIDLRAENRVYYAFRDGANGEFIPLADTQKENGN